MALHSPSIGDEIAFDENTWANQYVLRCEYIDTGLNNAFDSWGYWNVSSQSWVVSPYPRNIKVEKATGDWSDEHPQGDPPNVYNSLQTYPAQTDGQGNQTYPAGTVPAGKVRFFNQYGQMYTFTNPYVASGWATATSSSHTAATGTGSHNYVADSVRNIQCQKTAAYQIKWTFEEADFTFVGDVGFSVRKNGSTTDELDYVFASTDGEVEMVITSATQYPNSQIDTGDVITLHSDTNVQTLDSDGNWSYKTAGTVLGSFTYTATDVGYSISPTSPRCLDAVTITVSDTALFPDYDNEVVLSYTLDNPPSGYPGGSSANMVSTAFGGPDTLTSTNGHSLTGNFTASYDGSSLTGLPGILRIYRKTPSSTIILLGSHSISLPSQHRRAHSFW